jgi:chemotaxis protein methyltransferase CheR
MKKNYAPLASLFAQKFNVDLNRFDTAFLDQAIIKRMAETRCNSQEDYGLLLEVQPQEGKLFLESLHINYSEFFRNPLTFAVLERIVLPSLLVKRKDTQCNEIRIWSTACAGGQEVYSLGILLEELKGSDCHQHNYRIFATDYSTNQVAAAQKGQYPLSALNGVNLKRIKQCFTKQGEQYSIRPAFKKNIDFSVFDLFNEHYACPPASIFGDFDLVVCANLLFYYKPEYRKMILDKVSHSLSSGGLLITGESEREMLSKSGFQEIFSQSCIFRK